MKTGASIIVFTLIVTGIFTYIGNLVPQKEVYPPEELDLEGALGIEEMVAVGKTLVEGKGTCLSCHKIGSHEAGRFPDLKGIGAAAGSRREGLSDIDYLAEALYEPNAFIVQGFNPGMPPVNKAPINLSEREIRAVIAYLQSLGGAPSITMDTPLKYGSSEAVPKPEEESPANSGPLTADELIAQYNCAQCHSMTGSEPMLGPGLGTAGTRLSRHELYESLVDPEAVIAEGFPGGVMSATLNGLGFKNKVSIAELKLLVDHLANLKGVP